MAGNNESTAVGPLLFTLPEEVLLIALAFVPAETLALVMQVCRYFRRIAADPSLWRHQVNRHYASQAQALDQFLHPDEYERPEEGTPYPRDFRQMYARLYRARQCQFGPGPAGLVNWSQSRISGPRPSIFNALVLAEGSESTLQEMCKQLQRCNVEGKSLLDYAYCVRPRDVKGEDRLDDPYLDQPFLDEIYACFLADFPNADSEDRIVLAALTNQVKVVSKEYLDPLPRDEAGNLLFRVRPHNDRKPHPEKIFHIDLMKIALRYGYRKLLETFPEDGDTLLLLLNPTSYASYKANPNLLATIKELGAKIFGEKSQTTSNLLFQRLQDFMATRDQEQPLTILRHSYPVYYLLLAVACSLNQVQYVQDRLEQQSYTTEELKDILSISVNYGALDVVRLLFEMHALTPDEDSSHLLYDAARYGHTPVAAYLIERGYSANATSPDRYKKTALQESAARADVRMMLLLLKHGADLYARNHYKEDAIGKVAYGKKNMHLRLPAMKVLRQACGTPLSLHERAASFLDTCAERGPLAFFEYLLEEGITPTEKTLEQACLVADSEKVARLLEQDETLTLTQNALSKLLSRDATDGGEKVVKIIELLFETGQLHQLSADALQHAIGSVEIQNLSVTLPPKYRGNKPLDETIKRINQNHWLRLYALLLRAKMSTSDVCKEYQYKKYETLWEETSSLKNNIDTLITSCHQAYSLTMPLLEALRRLPDPCDHDHLFDLVRSHMKVGGSVPDFECRLTFILDKIDEARHAQALQDLDEQNESPVVEPTRVITVQRSGASM